MELIEFIKKLKSIEDYEGMAIYRMEEDIEEYLIPDLIKKNDNENVKYLVEALEGVISKLKILHFIAISIENKNEELYDLFLNLMDIEYLEKHFDDNEYVFSDYMFNILNNCIYIEDIKKLKYFSEIKINDKSILNLIINITNSYNVYRNNCEFELLNLSIHNKNKEIFNYLIIDNKLDLYNCTNEHNLSHFTIILEYGHNIEIQKEKIGYLIEIGYKLTNRDIEYLNMYDKNEELKNWIKI